ncbi:MAG: hypothetical protein ILO53_01570 [Clostridia bacterium]|nr:hypothetical protein [Clostridia bacterium]
MEKNYRLIIILSLAALFAAGLFLGGIVGSGSFHDVAGVLSTAFFLPGAIILLVGLITLLLKGKLPWTLFAIITGGASLLTSFLFLMLYYLV